MTLFFYGANLYALRQQVSKMSNEYIKRTGSDFGLERIDGSSIKVKELLTALQAAPFLAASRLVIVEGMGANKASIPYDDILAGVPASTVAIFIEPHVDRRTTYFKDMGGADKVLEFKALTSSQLSSWIGTEVSRLGGEIDRAATSELIELVGDDQWRLAEEINKLFHFQAKITTESVRNLVVAGSLQTIFDLVDAMTVGRTAAALSAYHSLLSQRENELYILTMIQWQLRNLLWAATAPDGITQSELAKAAAISPYVAGKIMTNRKRYSRGVITSAYVHASEAEFDIKTGRVKAETAVEQLIFEIACSVTSKV